MKLTLAVAAVVGVCGDSLEAAFGARGGAAEKLMLQRADRDLADFEHRTSLGALGYSIFHGRSALRDLPADDEVILQPGIDKTACAALLLLRGHTDAAHEVILGVSRDSIDEAEYAATHPGSGWAKAHPLSDSADLLHALLHRLEGQELGEGNHTGFSNAKFWLAGGDKKLEAPAPHPIRSVLAAKAQKSACLRRLGLVPTAERKCAQHRIIAGGGQRREVAVPVGEWDGFAFVDVCEKWQAGALSPEEAVEVAAIQRAELELLLNEGLSLSPCLSLSVSERPPI